MKQLTGLDAGFLYMETPTTFGHIASLSIYETRTRSGEAPYELFMAQVESRLGLLEPFRRRLVDVPFQLDHPWWIEDPSFDLDFHIRHIAVPPPGRDDELAELVGRIIGRPLDRSRPLWEAYVIEGLADGRWALLLKLHHATIDGAAGAEMLTMLLDAAPNAPTPDNPGPPAPDDIPSPVQMMTRTAMGFALRPERIMRAQLKVARQSVKIIETHGAEELTNAWRAWAPNRRDPSEVDPAPKSSVVGPAPTTPFNRAITPHRRFAFRTTALSDVKTVKNAFGATINDVVMAACAGGLRRYLDGHGMLGDRPLVAGVPVSIRTGDETEKWTNRVSSLIAAIPTHLPDPLDRLAFVHDAMVEAKTTFDLVPVDALQDFTQFSPPALFAEAANVMTRMRLADRLSAPINLIISNVPGPRQPLYLGATRMVHYYPVSTIVEGQGLNITVQSYEDKLDFGLVGCRELMSDLWDLLDMITDELAILTALARDATAST